VLSKVGPTFPLGYLDTLQQFDEVRHVFEPETCIILTPRVVPCSCCVSCPLTTSTHCSCTGRLCTLEAPQSAKAATWRATAAARSTPPLLAHRLFVTFDTRYNETQCRLSTWKAMLTIFDSGRARSIGVSNYNTPHLQEIVDAQLPLPSINQCPFNACAATPNITTDISCEM
jgi:hypothetical protein